MQISEVGCSLHVLPTERHDWIRMRNEEECLANMERKWLGKVGLLFDLDSDPTEQHDWAAAPPEQAARMRRALGALWVQIGPVPEALATAIAPMKVRATHEATLQRLRTLGYVQDADGRAP